MPSWTNDFPYWRSNTPPNTPSWELNGTKYWRLFIAEYLQPNKFKEKPNFSIIYQVSCFSSPGDASRFHVFPEKHRISLSARGKRSCFREKNTIFPDSTRRIMCRCGPFWKDHLFIKYFIKRWSFQKGPHRHMILLVLSGKMVFFSRKHDLFPRAESEIRCFSGNTWKRDASPGEEKQETWYIMLKFGFSLNLFGWRYSAMNNLQYFVPFSSQEGVFGGVFERQ